MPGLAPEESSSMMFPGIVDAEIWASTSFYHHRSYLIEEFLGRCWADVTGAN